MSRYAARALRVAILTGCLVIQSCGHPASKATENTIEETDAQPAIINLKCEITSTSRYAGRYGEGPEGPIARTDYYQIDPSNRSMKTWDSEKAAFANVCRGEDKCEVSISPGGFRLHRQFITHPTATSMSTYNYELQVSRSTGELSGFLSHEMYKGAGLLSSTKTNFTGKCEAFDPTELKPKF